MRKVRGLNAPAIARLLKRAGLVRPATNAMSSAIGAHLRQMRVQRGLPLARVAKAAGISVGFLSALERSHMSASVSKLRWFNPGRTETRVLWVNTPPTF